MTYKTCSDIKKRKLAVISYRYEAYSPKTKMERYASPLLHFPLFQADTQRIAESPDSVLFWSWIIDIKTEPVLVYGNDLNLRNYRRNLTHVRVFVLISGMQEL